MKFLLITVYLLTTNLVFAEETKLKDGVVFRRTYTCQMTAGLEAGNKKKKEIDGQWVYVQKLKASDYIPPGEILPLQSTEDNRDGNTDYVIVRVDTWERIAKDKHIKATDSVFVEDNEYIE